MIERFLKVRKCVCKAMIDIHVPCHLNEEDYSFLGDLLAALKPVHLAAEAIGRRDATLLTAEGAFKFLFKSLLKLETRIARDLYEALKLRIGQRRQKNLASLMKYLNK